MKLLVFLLLPYLSLSEVGQNFNQCSRFFLKDVPPQFTPPAGVSVQHICQCVWDDSDQKMYLYATLYSITWRIPIYSAYEFESHRSIGRCDVWYIEPQLDDKDADPCMSPKGYKRTIGNKQAVNSDYKDSKYDKGHLYPVQHTDNHLSMVATSTLTNAAPQNPTFNRQEWKKHEEDVKDDLKNCNGKAYVVTGVVPDTNIKIPTKNPRVTVSKYYWRATCCLKNNMFIGQGYYGPDNNGKVQKLSITDLQTRLAKDYNVNIIIFPNVPSLPGPSNPKKPRQDGCN
ncbi:endonuclease domain-containing 1 protein-like [Ctenopharyngodon idella]|uniref:endonuclease domain-containing 1 protein-like n=1 Tax=Ctenopharyngodon idella TaxID=7959 RepID=UPI002232669D|nr:endonuclease domain-containing 1 protein-like [Ctenopharyngodon idella]